MLLLAACGTPEDKVARLRGMYSAELNGFIIQQEPAAEPAMAAEEGTEATEEIAEEAPAEAEAEGEGEGEGELAPEPMAPVNPDVMIDLLIKHDSPKLLPGITVDVTMVDEAKTEKASWKIWFDTSKVKKANVTGYTYVLENVPYVEGDGFFAEVRHPVPAEERGDYKEFSSAG
jgi:hypothetical protein